MTRRIILLAGLAILGLVFIGGGLRFLLRPVPQVELPEGTPIAAEKLDFVMRGRFDRLYIYEDGSVVHVQDTNIRLSGPGNPPTRIWGTGRLQADQFSQIIELFQSSQFAALEKNYQFPDKPIEGGGFTAGDMSCTLSIVYGDLNKPVTASGYLTVDQGATYPDMPYPINELYAKLNDFMVNQTQEVAREHIPEGGGLWQY
jgi:hypothetical protein